MKKLNLLILASMLMFLMSSCDWFSKILSVDFDTNSTDVSFTVDPTSAGSHQLKLEVIKSDLAQEIKDNGGDIKNLKSVQLQKATAMVISAGRNLDAFQSLDVIVRTDGQADKKVAWVDNIPQGSTSVDLSITTDELKGLIDQDQYTIIINGVLSQDLKESIDLKVSVVYHVTVGP